MSREGTVQGFRRRSCILIVLALCKVFGAVPSRNERLRSRLSVCEHDFIFLAALEMDSVIDPGQSSAALDRRFWALDMY